MRHEPPIFFHLKLVAKISLALGVIALSALVIALTLVTDQGGESYSAIVQVQQLKSDNLGKVMLLVGLVLLTLTSLVTWAIALYSSLRIAGPLYRFSQNLQLATADEAAPLVALRKGDALNAEAELIQQTVQAVRTHQGALDAALRQAAEAISRGDPDGYAQAVAHLRRLDEQVQL